MYRGHQNIHLRPSPPAAAKVEDRGGTVFVCSLAEFVVHAEALRPSHIISLVPSYEQPPTPAGVPARQHLRLEIDDIERPLPGHSLPEMEHVADLIAFVRWWDQQRPMLLHCAAGISRSMAAALIAATIRSEATELDAAIALRTVAPHARPNRRIIGLADQLLGRRGRLIFAVDAMGPAQEVVRGPLVRLPTDLQEPEEPTGQQRT